MFHFLTWFLFRRLTNQVDKQVTMAIELIRSAAEALRDSDDITQLSSHSSLKLADKEYLLEGFKFLINSSDRHEQVRLLTLAPPEWGRTKVEEYFECSRSLPKKLSISTVMMASAVSLLTNVM
jgi:hypothetical protein